jgi:hypothetical protein
MIDPGRGNWIGSHSLPLGLKSENSLAALRHG